MDDSVKMRNFYSDDLIAGGVEIAENLFKQIKQAETEAVIRGIKANVVAINDKLLFSRLQRYFQDIPMILGLKCVYTDQLPDDILFSVFEAPNPPLNANEENIVLREENKKTKRYVKAYLRVFWQLRVLRRR